LSGTAKSTARRSAAVAVAPAPQRQRKCACGGTVGPTGECAQCRARRLASGGRTLQRLAGIGVGRDAGRSPATVTVPGTEVRGSETANGEGPSTPAAAPAPFSGGGCGVTGSFTDIPAGTLAATLTGKKLGASFNMVGEYSPTGGTGCTCSCGEYRQYVRGYFNVNGTDWPHDLCGTPLSRTSFNEDCKRSGGVDYKYGYRANRFATSYFDNPDQLTGCRFNGFDFPGFTGASGDVIEVNLDFMGSLVDVCSNATIAGSDWSVVGKATIP
jgi:hypothetical protein